MARTLRTPSPLDTIEEAFDLLQRAPASLWLRYALGAFPLAIGFLWVWGDCSAGYGTPESALFESALLVALVVWFYHCRQMMAGELRRILGSVSTGEKPKRPGLAAACFEGTRMLAMPLAMLCLMLPIGMTTAFYRGFTGFSGQGLSASEAASRAWKAARIGQRENWFVIAILHLLALCVFLDVLLVVLIGPQLVRMFTGYESVFTQRGAQTIAIQMPVILAISWLCLDPLLQSVYVVRNFAWEGLRTGDDLLAKLRRLTPLLLLLLAMRAPCRAAEPAIPVDDLNRSIDQTLNSREYDWRKPPEATDVKKDWFVDQVDRLMAAWDRGWRTITKYWDDFWDWYRRLTHRSGYSDEAPNKMQPSVIRPVFYGVAIVVLLMTLAAIWKFRPRRTEAELKLAATPPPIDLSDESLLASDLPEDEWIRMSEHYANSGDLRLALRALYLGTLALLGDRGLVTVNRCKSNRDYEQEVRRRARSTDLSQIFRQNIRSFEQAWYGFHDVTGDQLRSFRDNLGQMRQYAAKM